MVEKLTGGPAFGRVNFKAELEKLVPLLAEVVWYLGSRATAHSKHDSHVIVQLRPWGLERRGSELEG